MSLVNVPPIGTKERGAVPSLIWTGAAWVAPAKTAASMTVLVASSGMLVGSAAWELGISAGALPLWAGTCCVTGFQGRKPRPCGLATDWSKFWEPARALGKKTENAARAWRIRLGLYALEFACRYAWESLGAIGVART